MMANVCVLAGCVLALIIIGIYLLARVIGRGVKDGQKD